MKLELKLSQRNKFESASKFFMNLIFVFSKSMNLNFVFSKSMNLNFIFSKSMNLNFVFFAQLSCSEHIRSKSILSLIGFYYTFIKVYLRLFF